MNTVSVSDEELVERFFDGSEESFEELLSRYEAKAYRLAMRLLRNAEDAEEVLQDVFVTLYRKLDTFRGQAAFSSWLYRITVNAAFMKMRKRRPLNPELAAVTVPRAAIGGAEQLEQQETREVLERALDRLPREYRVVFLLRDGDGLSNEEVAGILDISLSAVKSRLHRARAMLRKRLQRSGLTNYEGRAEAMVTPR